MRSSIRLIGGRLTMCRLYAMHANEPTRVECSLVRAQNALMAQSRGDKEGLMHGHGWGVADYPDGVPIVERQTWAAFHGEHFQKKAARIYAKTVVAHVRRATVGPPALQNTHPFVHGRWIFAHNGTIPNFQQVRPMMLDATDPLHRNEIHGDTDSEHMFRFLLTLWMQRPDRDLLTTLKIGLRQIVAWSRHVDAEARIGLNIILTDGDKLVGSRLNRTLWFLNRDRTYACPICKRSHVHHDPKASYSAIEVASEAITQEAEWTSIPNGTVFSANSDFELWMEPLEV